MSRVWSIATASLLACSASVAHAQAAAPPRAIAFLADYQLGDAALAVADSVRPVIYYNPTILERSGPAMSAFILAHEEAHIHMNHTLSDRGAPDLARLRRLELDADCYAARSLVRGNADAVAAATLFFGARGADRIDDRHPTGTERASRISACATTSVPSEADDARGSRGAGNDSLTMR